MLKTMLTPFEEHGRWWSPNSNALGDQGFHGKLSWDPVEGASIEATGLSAETTYNLSRCLGSPILIQGQLDDIPCVTLEDAMVVSCTPAIFGLGKVKIIAKSIAKGDDVLNNFCKTTLLNMSCELTGLDVWTRGSGIRITHPEPQRTLVECLPFEDQLFAISDDIEIRIARWNRTSHVGRRFSTETVDSFELHAETPFSYEKGRGILDELKAFLTLALDRPVVFESIRGRLLNNDQKMPDGSPIARHIEFFQTVDEHTMSSSKKERNKERIPFFLKPIERSAQAFKVFCQICRSNRMALDFFFSQTYGGKSYVNQQFADMVHGLEGLHRGLRGGTYIEQDNYDTTVLPAMIQGIPTGIDDQLRQALKKRLEFGNEYSLRRRLKDLARFHDTYAGRFIGKPVEFADTVATMRNSLAHATGADIPDRVTVTRYLIMLHRVRLLFQLELFHQLGFSSEFLSGCIPRLQSAELALRQLP